MGILAKLLGLGPLLLGLLIIVCAAVFANVPALAPYAPLALIFLPALILSFLAWVRAYPAAASPLAESSNPFVFWHAACPELGFMVYQPTKHRVNDGPIGSEEKTYVFDDWPRLEGYAVKVLRVADVKKNYETTTEEELMLLLDRVVKAIEGVSDVEAKLIIDRGPAGEIAYVILSAEVVDGDEEGARNAVEHAAKTLADAMEPLGIILLDDDSYLGKVTTWGAEMPAPSRVHGYAVAAAASATLCLSILSLPFGGMAAATLISGLAGLAVAGRLLASARKANCPRCAAVNRHRHWALEGGCRYEVEPGGVIVRRGGREAAASRYVSITNNMNKDLSVEDLDKRLPIYVATFSNMIYSLRDFRIAIHIRPEAAADVLRLAMAKADFYGLDAQAGGAVSGYLKAGRSMNLANRIMHGERPYSLSGVVEVRVRGRRITRRELDILDKQVHAVRSMLDSMNFSTKEVSDGYGAMLCLRFMYLPPPKRAPLDPNPIPSVKALTRDFVALTPIAFRKRPYLPRDGLYIGRDPFGKKVYWNPELLPNPHILVLGAPGYGKSTLVKSMIFRLSQLVKYSGTGKPPSVIIVDPAGEYAREADELREQGVKVTVIDLYERKYNPLLLAGLSPLQRIHRVVDWVLPSVMELSQLQLSVLAEGLEKLYIKLAKVDFNDPKTWDDGRVKAVTMRWLYEYVRYVLRNAREEVVRRGGNPDIDPWILELLDLERKMRGFCLGAFALDRTDLTIDQLLSIGGVAVISFRTEAAGGEVAMSEEMQKLITWSILEHIKDYMISRQVKEGVRLIVVIDEGHKFLLGKRAEVPIAQHLRETRKFGVSYVIITHMVDDLLQDMDLAKRRATPAAASLVSTAIAFGFGDKGEVAKVAELLNLSERDARELQGLHIGECFVKWSNDPRPLYVKVEPDPRALVRRRASRREVLREAQ